MEETYYQPVCLDFGYNGSECKTYGEAFKQMELMQRRYPCFRFDVKKCTKFVVKCIPQRKAV